MSELASRAVARSGASRLIAEPRVRYVATTVVLAGLYYAAAQIGYELKFSGAVAAIVWLPVGVGISFLYLGGLRLWPGVLAGDLIANQYQALPVGSGFGQSIGNVLEIVIAAALLRRLVKGNPLESVAGVCGVLIAICVGTAESATVGPFSLRLGGVITTGDLPHVWHTWWLGDTAGALVVVPFALAWWRPLRVNWEPARVVEATILMLAIVVLTELALRNDRPLSYIVFPALIWAALRFGPRGATLAVAFAAGFTLWKTAHHAGPFVVSSLPRSTLSTQLYVAVASVSTMFLAAVVSEREAFARGLASSRARLVGVADRERRRLEQNLHDGAQLTLTLLAGQLAVAKADARRAPENGAARLEAAENEVLVAIDQLRELAHGIHPTVLTDLGLAEAIRSFTAASPVTIELLELPADRVGTVAEATAYYVIAEAVTNAQRHARAGAISIRAGRLDGALRVEVADNGVGGADPGGSGLQGLRDRVEAVGGDFDVATAAGRGTRVRAVVPVDALPPDRRA
jgi:signal transduction histidine kinase